MNSVKMLDKETDSKVAEWLLWDKNETTRLEIKDLVNKKDDKELQKRLCSRMEFGTAGLRARMGAGYSQMNDLTIIQTAQGFVKYMEQICPNLKTKGVVIGYDARHNSTRWAELSATILVQRGIKVYLYSTVTPTPFVPYAVLKYGADWGIMVTASHNPKWDNGYKVYYGNGAQIISPHDRGIAASIMENLEPWLTSWDTSILKNHSLVMDPYQEVFTSYMHDLRDLCHFSDKNEKTGLKFTYTAMHGVGYEAIQAAFAVFRFPPCIPVVEQVHPDPEFPTVKFPNPEEGRSALDLAIKTANKNGSTVILANDPDADRLAIAEKLPDGGWHVFSGNEIGSLIGWWLYERFHSQHPHVSGDDVYCLASTVSSKILQTISTREGFNFVETLTGFKWMGNKAHDLKQKNKTVLFAFEEAIGFMCGTHVLDKDGVSAAMVSAEMATYLASQGSTIKQQLQTIYDKYGYHVSNNAYFLCHDPSTIVKMFDRIRNYEGTDKYPSKCGPYSIKYIRDLTTGYDNSQPDNKATLPVSKSSQMITFIFESGCVMTLRTSGTEPKIKYYTELIADQGIDRQTTEAELKKHVQHMIEEFFQPEKNNLVPKEP